MKSSLILLKRMARSLGNMEREMAEISRRVEAIEKSRRA